MKTIILVAIGLMISLNSFAQDFLPASVETKTGAYKILTKCGLEDNEGKCTSFYFYYSTPGHFENTPDIVKLITPVAFTARQVESLKVEGLYYNVLNGGDAFVTTEDFSEGLNVIWIPLAFGIDVVGGALGTPFFAAHKVISNFKYKKLIKALEKNSRIKMSHQGLQILVSDLCQIGKNTVYRAAEAEFGFQFARKNVGGCGFVKKIND